MGFNNLADANDRLFYYPWQGTEGLGHVAMFRWDTDTLSWVKFSGDSAGISANVTVLNSSLVVSQPTHDNLNLNANSQWLDTDTDTTNPLPTQLRNSSGTELATAGAPLRIDPTGTTSQPVTQGTHDNLNLNANVQQSNTDIGPVNPLAIAALVGAVQVDVDSGDSTITYVGYAAAGTATSSASWRIFRITSSGDATSIDTADGDISFNNIWDNRESLSYS